MGGGGGYNRCIYLCLAWVTFCFRGKGGKLAFLLILDLPSYIVGGGGLILAVYTVDASFGGIDAETSAASPGHPQTPDTSRC